MAPWNEWWGEWSDSRAGNILVSAVLWSCGSRVWSAYDKCFSVSFFDIPLRQNLKTLKDRHLYTSSLWTVVWPMTTQLRHRQLACSLAPLMRDVPLQLPNCNFLLRHLWNARRTKSELYIYGKETILLRIFFGAEQQTWIPCMLLLRSRECVQDWRLESREPQRYCSCGVDFQTLAACTSVPML